MAWDVTTAVYSQLFSVAAQETTPTGVFFKPDGLKMYVIGYSGDDVNEYDLPAAAIMNQFQKANIGADLYNGALAI